MTELEQYYNKFNEEKRLNSRHGQIEFITSMKYIHEYIPEDREKSDVKILDIGAGTGRYSVALAEEGYDVTAVELVKYNLGILKKKNSNVKAMQGNALKLSKLKDETFDVTLLFGPMYHLFGVENKKKALEEAKRVTKKGDEPYYPMNDEKNNALYEKYKALADGQNKVIFGGRLGMYKYFDMHQVIEEALLVSEKELA